MGPRKGDTPPAHVPSPYYDETTAFTQTSYPTQMSENEYVDTYDRRRKSKALMVIVPICVLLFVAGVAAGFLMNQSDDDTDNDLAAYAIAEPVIEDGLVIETPETIRNHSVSAPDGVSLLTVELIEWDNYRSDDSLFIGSQGHRYHESVIFNVSARGDYIDNAFSYAIYNLDNRYTTFFADVVLRGTQPEYLEFLVEIAFDDVVEPVKTIEGYNVNMAPLPIELDVSGVTRMYIIVRGRGSNTLGVPYGLRFGNPTLQ